MCTIGLTEGHEKSRDEGGEREWWWWGGIGRNRSGTSECQEYGIFELFI